MAIELYVFRYSSQKNDTLGILKDENKNFFSYTLEDEKREVKVPGETRIKEGRYKLQINKSDTPLTLKHREAYNKNYPKAWFNFHIEITGVPDFKGIYIHAGNTEKHTDGCLLIGNTVTNNLFEDGVLGDSISAVKRFYDKYYPLLLKETEIYINISTI